MGTRNFWRPNYHHDVLSSELRKKHGDYIFKKIHVPDRGGGADIERKRMIFKWKQSIQVRMRGNFGLKVHGLQFTARKAHNDGHSRAALARQWRDI